ncbi:MAG: YihY/virulence factor BrkB family protein [Acetobacteraceae bacterium]
MIGSTWTILKETFKDFMEDVALSRGAAIAFYTILSLGPVLLLCIAIAGLVFGQEAAQGAMVGQLRGLMGDQAGEAIQGMIANAANKKSGIWATVIGFVTLMITASGVFLEMQSALNFIWKAEPKGGLTTMLKARAASLGLVATMGFLLLVSLVVSAGLHALGDYLNSFLPGAELLFQVINFVISFAMVSALFAAIYKILPDRKLQWKDVIVGAVVTALLFTIGKTLIGIYIGSSGVASSYGAAGALIVILLWIYYSSVIFLLGSEFTKVWAAHHGSQEAFAARTQQEAPKAPVSAASAVQATIAHGAQHRSGIGLFDIAALGTLLLVALKGAGEKKTGWF